MVDQRPARRRIVVATGDLIGERMAGPGIRALHIARALAAEHEVRLISTAGAERHGEGIDMRTVDDEGVTQAERWCEVFIGQGWVLAGNRALRRSRKVIVADLYDPMHLEQLEQAREGDERSWWEAVNATTAVLNEQLLRGDHFLCASARQRDLWLGHLACLGRVNPATYAEHGGLETLLSVVPFGLPDDPPVRVGPGLRGVVPGIGAGDQVALWGGGIYNWFDPLTLIRALDLVRRDLPRARLVFMGGRHPNPAVPEMRAAAQARQLAEELGLLGRHVFFNEGWVPYDRRQDVLLDADVGVSTHLVHLETEFAARTRVLDYLWAGLPVVATRGDAMAELVERQGAGVVVEPSDVVGLAHALRDLLGGDADIVRACRSSAARLAGELRWSVVLEPVLEFCRRPRRAADLVHPSQAWRVRRWARAPRSQGWGARADRWHAYLREGGPRLVIERLAARLGGSTGPG